MFFLTHSVDVIYSSLRHFCGEPSAVNSGKNEENMVALPSIANKNILSNYQLSNILSYIFVTKTYIRKLHSPRSLTKLLFVFVFTVNYFIQFLL